MTYALASINPFLAARCKPRSLSTRPNRYSEPHRAVYAKLPMAPRNASPVPSLTSLYHNAVAGNYGDRGYPGNCGGNLIKDLLKFFDAKTCFDPMTGSGTCR